MNAILQMPQLLGFKQLTVDAASFNGCQRCYDFNENIFISFIFHFFDRNNALKPPEISRFYLFTDIAHVTHIPLFRKKIIIIGDFVYVDGC